MIWDLLIITRKVYGYLTVAFKEIVEINCLVIRYDHTWRDLNFEWCTQALYWFWIVSVAFLTLYLIRLKFPRNKLIHLKLREFSLFFWVFFLWLRLTDQVCFLLERRLAFFSFQLDSRWLWLTMNLIYVWHCFLNWVAFLKS